MKNRIDSEVLGDVVKREDSDIFVDKEAYVSTEFVRLEREKLWPKVWQVACREEEIPRPGDYITYEIADESVIIVRGKDGRIRAFNNACTHRGRRITEGCGKTGRLFCKYHGWQWDLNGRISEIPSREDWGGALDDEDVALTEFKTGTWGGFVFMNFDPDCEPLSEYLAPIPEYLDCLELERFRFNSYVTFEVAANWKTAQEAFTEAYHIQTTHRQAEPYMDTRATTHERGKHMQMIDSVLGEIGYHVPNPEPDMRKALLEVFKQFSEGTVPFSTRAYDAAKGVMDLPESASLQEVGFKALELQMVAAKEGGYGFPEAPVEKLVQALVDWNFFPNLTCVLSFDAAIFYRIRPKGDDPDRCIFDLWRLWRYADGEAPPLVREEYPEWTDFKEMPHILSQDFSNIADVQRGMKTTAWKGAITNPRQERSITHFHEVLKFYLGLGPASNAIAGKKSEYKAG